MVFIINPYRFASGGGYTGPGVYTDFSEYTAGAAPSDWSVAWGGALGGVNMEIVTDASAPGGKVLRVTAPTSGDGEYGIIWDTPGSISGDLDVLMLVRAKVGGASSGSGQYLRLLSRATAGASANAYFGSLNGTAGGLATVGFGRLVAGAQTFVTTTQNYGWGTELSGGTSVYMRLTISGNTKTFRVWAQDETEGDASNGLASESTWTDHSAGYVGIGMREDGEAFDISFFSYADGGDAAPTLEDVLGS